MTRRRPARAVVPTSVVALGLVVSGLAGCSAGPSDPTPTAASTGSAASAASAGSTAGAAPVPTATPTDAGPSPSFTEPTTTNTLPPPPEPSRPAASTAGTLTGGSLPVPAGWRRVVRKGGEEEGYQGNGTWVHARDARYAATDTVTIGCAEVTRDDFTDPVHALEGDYADPSGRPGVGLVLEFRTGAEAVRYLALYRRQVVACTDPDGPVLARLLPGVGSADGFADQRTYPGADRWSEVVERNGTRLTLIILSDPDRRVGAAAATRILGQISGRR